MKLTNRVLEDPQISKTSLRYDIIKITRATIATPTLLRSIGKVAIIKVEKYESYLETRSCVWDQLQGEKINVFLDQRESKSHSPPIK